MKSNTCPIFKKFYDQMPDTPSDIRHSVADSMCRQASKYNIPENLSAREIATIISMRQKQADAVKDKPQPQSKEEDPQGVPDKRMPISGYPDKKSCIDGLVNDLIIERSRAEEECNTQFGPGKGTVSAKTRIAVLDNIMKKYPKLSAKSANYIVNETIMEHSIKSASVETPVEVPYWITATNIDTNHLRSNKTSNLKGAALDKHAEYMQAILEPIAETLRNRVVHKDQESKIRSASVKEKEDEEIPGWARITGDL